MFRKIVVVLAAFLTASTASAQRVGEWHDDLNGSYYSGSGNTYYTPMLWGLLLGIFLMRMWEKHQGTEEGWLKTILMSLWICTPMSIFFVLFVFY